MATNLNFALSSVCTQRAKQRLFNVPPPRYNIVSPYGGQYTKAQLDMRRKAETLKYLKNTSSFSGTKSGKWSQLVKGNSNQQQGNYPSITITTVDYQNNFQTITVQYPNTITITPVSRYTTDEYGNRIINQEAYQRGLRGY